LLEEYLRKENLLEGKLLLLKAEQVELLENRFLFHSATILSMYHPVNTRRAQQLTWDASKPVSEPVALAPGLTRKGITPFLRTDSSCGIFRVVLVYHLAKFSWLYAVKGEGANLIYGNIPNYSAGQLSGWLELPLSH
jgi:hypothetical protein